MGSPLRAVRSRRRSRKTRSRRTSRSERIGLAIAGLDPTAGAGLAADLRAFASLGVWGTAAATAVTVQTTKGTELVVPMRADVVTAQIERVAADMRPDAVKVGMLGSSEVARAVASALADIDRGPVVLDTVLGSWDGSDLAGPGTIEIMRRDLIPQAACVTPNSIEAGILTGVEVTDLDSAESAARIIIGMGAGSALIKGGHLRPTEPEVSDLLVWHDGKILLRHRRVLGVDPHGTGCLLASLIAAGLALGWDLPRASREAITRMDRAMAAPLALGSGKPVLLVPT